MATFFTGSDFTVNKNDMGGLTPRISDEEFEAKIRKALCIVAPVFVVLFLASALSPTLREFPSILVRNLFDILPCRLQKPRKRFGAVGGKDKVGAVQAGKIAVEIADAAACLLQNQHCGGVVPALQAELKIELAMPPGQIAQFHSRGAEPSHIVALPERVHDDAVAQIYTTPSTTSPLWLRATEMAHWAIPRA